MTKFCEGQNPKAAGGHSTGEGGGDFHQSEPKRRREPAPIQGNPGNTELVPKRRRRITKGRSGHRDARPLRGSIGAVAKKRVVGRCRASTSHLTTERGELNEKEGIPSQRTPIKYEKLGELLKAEGYDKQKTNYLVSGFKDGFRLRLDRKTEELAQQQLDMGQQPVQNHKSASRKPVEVELKLKKELEAGRMLGPFSQPIFDYYCISPLGQTEKKVLGKYRLIQDLSALREGLSVNDAIPVEAGAVSYDTVDNEVRMIQSYGQGSVLGKTDVEHAYKLVPIHRGDIPALGMRWGGRLAMGRHPPDGDQVRIRHLRGLFISSAVLGRKKGVWTNESRTGRLLVDCVESARGPEEAKTFQEVV